MRLIWLVIALLLGVSAYASPPRDATGQFRDWFQGLTVPGVPGAPCCTLADCRRVDARWNDRTQHHEARVDREIFSDGLGRTTLSLEDNEAYQAARSVWMKQWIARYGDSPFVWIEIPEAKINPVQNPTGHAVLCWSVFNSEFNGVYCFVPITSAINEHFEQMNMFV